MRIENFGTSRLDPTESSFGGAERGRVIADVLPAALSKKYGEGNPSPEDLAAFENRYGFNLEIILNAVSRKGQLPTLPRDEAGLRQLAENIIASKERTKKEAEREKQNQEIELKRAALNETKPKQNAREEALARIIRQQEQKRARGQMEKEQLRQIYERNRQPKSTR